MSPCRRSFTILDKPPICIFTFRSWAGGSDSQGRTQKFLGYSNVGTFRENRKQIALLPAQWLHPAIEVGATS
jgi:hypothetical protein